MPEDFPSWISPLLYTICKCVRRKPVLSNGARLAPCTSSNWPARSWPVSVGRPWLETLRRGTKRGSFSVFYLSAQFSSLPLAETKEFPQKNLSPGSLSCLLLLPLGLQPHCNQGAGRQAGSDCTRPTEDTEARGSRKSGEFGGRVQTIWFQN